ncbi:chromate efflux transporter [Oceanicella sp. SM1341]|uniref:chromate efflux transporter n=1 Tax=Oceanicella sp. SM1341 TaxID=1548889 RepID=UPI001E3ADAAD|nr:chromate efflux transporter [Oceanicella sp. SM1341]
MTRELLPSGPEAPHPAPEPQGGDTAGGGSMPPSDVPPGRPGLWEGLAVHLRIGLLSFGGPAGQIALMQDEIVTRRGWVSAERFRRGLAVAMLLPGPEAQQLATFLGWCVHGRIGGLVAGLSFVLPGAALMIAIAWAAAEHGELPAVQALFAGLQPAVLVIVLLALLRLARGALPGWRHAAVAVAAFAALAVAGLSFPLVVGLAALAGLALPAPAAPEVAAAPGRGARRGLFAAAATLGAGAAVVLAAWLASRSLFGPEPQDALAGLFTSAALVTFGGAYAVLPYVAERAVTELGWLTGAQMLTGLALAEATPGPLILVNVYAGFFAGWPAGGWAGAGTAALACLYTFVPSLSMMLAAAPHVEAMQRAATARRALAGVSAAVVGVIANLALFLGTAALFPAGPADGPEPVRLALFLLLGAWGLWRRPPMLLMVAVGGLAGLGLHALGLV